MDQSNNPDASASTSGKFPLGQIVGTPRAIAAIGKSGENPAALLSRHHNRDHGVVSAKVRKANDLAIRGGDRILSSYILRDGVKLWITSEPKRGVTTFLLPEDFIGRFLEDCCNRPDCSMGALGICQLVRQALSSPAAMKKLELAICVGDAVTNWSADDPDH